MRHGGDLSEAAALFGAADWLDLSTGINPHPWPLPADLAFAGWDRLPTAADREAALAAARRAYRVPSPLAIVAVPGTTALIQWLPRLLPAGPVRILGPTYGGHETAWRDAGASLAPTDEAAPHVVLVNPNNPDGRLVPVDRVLRLARDCRERGGWLIVDESFGDLDPDAGIAPHAGDLPIVVLRSFGKFYGLPGLRLGFGLLPHALAASVRTALGDWPVSTPALLVGARALDDADWATAMRARLAREARDLDRVLAAAGLSPAGGTALFRLVRHPEARAVHDRLARAGIWTRRFDWAPDLLRIGLPGPAGGLDRLAAALGLGR